MDYVGWVSASAAVIAAVGTSGALWVAALAYRQQQHDGRREHASKITVIRGTHRADVDAAEAEDDRGAWVMNSSDQPAYRCIVLFVDPATGQRVATGHVIEVLAPHGNVFARPAAGQQALARLGDRYDVEVGFVDRAGIRWLRDRWGGLKEITREPVVKDGPAY